MCARRGGARGTCQRGRKRATITDVQVFLTFPDGLKKSLWLQSNLCWEASACLLSSLCLLLSSLSLPAPGKHPTKKWRHLVSLSYFNLYLSRFYFTPVHLKVKLIETLKVVNLKLAHPASSLHDVSPQICFTFKWHSGQKQFLKKADFPPTAVTLVLLCIWISHTFLPLWQLWHFLANHLFNAAISLLHMLQGDSEQKIPKFLKSHLIKSFNILTEFVICDSPYWIFWNSNKSPRIV